jgi:hypothetical protein
MRTEKQQTAVEWLFGQYVNKSIITIEDIEQAKEMEKEQIIDAFDEGNPNGFILKDGEQYYNETFISE